MLQDSFAGDKAMRNLAHIYDNLEIGGDSELNFILDLQDKVNADGQMRIVLIGKKSNPKTGVPDLSFVFAKPNGKPHKFDKKLWRVHLVGVLRQIM